MVASRIIYLVVVMGMVRVRGECWYDNKKHLENSQVSTGEPCLNCTCTKSALLCYLRVCPKLPDPPPLGCILLHRYQTCCPELICSDVQEGSNSLEARAEPEGDVDVTGDDLGVYHNACISNGTIYSPGSAMHSSSLCEYCYCLGGKQICVKPKCLMPLDGCSPMFEENCCPVRYHCSRITGTTTTYPPLTDGCFVEKRYYPEGSRVFGMGYSACDNCYCLRGVLRCEPLSCAPPLLGCEPVVKKGECCAASYNCNGTLQIQPYANYAPTPIISKEYSKLRKEIQRKPSKQGDQDAPFYVIAESVQEPKLVFQRSPTTTFVNEADNRGGYGLVEEVTTEEGTTEFTTIPTTTTATEGLVTMTTVIKSSDCIDGVALKDNDEIDISTVDPADVNELEETSTVFSTTVVEEKTTEDVKLITKDIEAILNISRHQMEPEIDYDYNEPTLPPSLPNLKIIPFVAADALDAKKPKDPDFIEEKIDTAPLQYTPNMFKPPEETEGGFIPKEPSIIDSYYNVATPSLTTETSLNVIHCIYQNEDIRHGMPAPSDSPCITCACYYGNIVCEKVATCQTPPVQSNLDKVLQLIFSSETTTAPSTTTEDVATTVVPSLAGILKLAGCNIYGRMYRVGRIISELSGPCLECKCTEVGVKCRQLKCT